MLRRWRRLGACQALRLHPLKAAADSAHVGQLHSRGGRTTLLLLIQRTFSATFRPGLSYNNVESPWSQNRPVFPPPPPQATLPRTRLLLLNTPRQSRHHGREGARQARLEDRPAGLRGGARWPQPLCVHARARERIHSLLRVSLSRAHLWRLWRARWACAPARCARAPHAGGRRGCERAARGALCAGASGCYAGASSGRMSHPNSAAGGCVLLWLTRAARLRARRARQAARPSGARRARTAAWRRARRRPRPSGARCGV
jgi:hypothetical protein